MTSRTGEGKYYLPRLFIATNLLPKQLLLSVSSVRGYFLIKGKREDDLDYFFCLIDIFLRAISVNQIAIGCVHASDYSLSTTDSA